jgi:hypothetical protein
VVQHRRVHRRHSLEHRHPVALDDFQGLARIEARDQRQAGARRDRGVEAARLAEGMEEGQSPEQDVVGAEREELGHHLDVADQVLVGELGALRGPGGPRGVEDHGGVLGLSVGDLLRRLGLGHQALELARRDEHELAVGLVGARLGRLREVMPGEQDLRARVGEVEADLAALEQHVHRHDDGAETQDAVVARGEVRNVRKHDAHPIAGLDAPRAQQPGHARRRGIELRVGELSVVELHRHPIAVLGGRALQVLCQVHLSPPRRCSRAESMLLRARRAPDVAGAEDRVPPPP